MSTPDCKICGARTVAFGTKRGVLIDTTFEFSRCTACNFICVVNPCLDYARLYDANYYRGKGADPYVDYEYELEHPDETVRQYEWRGILDTVRLLFPDVAAARWLDYGCGNGGLVRYLRMQNIDAEGHDEGAIIPKARAKGIPIRTAAELDGATGRYSIITMIEVIEHLPDPLAVLRRVRGLLRPGGLLFLTTGNSAPYRDDFLRWRYVTPDIHISYFDPDNLQQALNACGFAIEKTGHVGGWNDIIRFKVLKSLGFKRTASWQSLIPWSLAAPLIDRKVRLSDHPVGRAA
jgi:SAM-dependent methyltransferase